MDSRIRDYLIIGGIVVVGYLLLVPRSKGIKKPQVASEGDVSQVQNARTVLDAFLNAYEAKEPASELNKLNGIFVKEYGLKVHKRKDGKFVARTLDGKDVLMVK